MDFSLDYMIKEAKEQNQKQQKKKEEKAQASLIAEHFITCIDALAS